MITLKKIKISRNLLVGILLSYIFFSCSEEEETPTNETPNLLEFSETLSVGTNTWLVKGHMRNSEVINEQGIFNWTKESDKFRIYFKTAHSGDLNVGLKLKTSTKGTKLKISLDNQDKEIIVNNTSFEDIEIGTFSISEPGYKYIEISCTEKKGTKIADISNLLLGSDAAKEINFIPSKNIHFGRRGPSVHMRYEIPNNKQVTWFYNELKVPHNQDKLGSFFMANGCSEGYFGIQVNSETERRILFSIWSAYSTDNPNEIPEDYKVVNLGSGDGVTVGNFGNEGSGKQCYKRYFWKADTTYKFLLKVTPSKNNSTDYTAYFFSPEKNKWEFIASLRRPKTNTYLKNPHSFLENFYPNTGDQTRKVFLSNQWAYTTSNQWIELKNGKFTVDATGTDKDRLDFQGGTEGAMFYLKNCGFFNLPTTPYTNFSRESTNKEPNINFNDLAKLIP